MDFNFKTNKERRVQPDYPVGYQQKPVYHKYDFFGEIRTYANKLTLIEAPVKYLGATTIFVDHWDVNYTVDDFLKETEKYNKPAKDLINPALFITKIKPFKVVVKNKKLVGISMLNEVCCYCECRLTLPHNENIPTSKTKDHVIPKIRGGSDRSENIRPCCYECNQEKGGLMLHSYIQLLNMQLLDKTSNELLKLQTKIKNANRIAKEIETKN